MRKFKQYRYIYLNENCKATGNADDPTYYATHDVVQFTKSIELPDDYDHERDVVLVNENACDYVVTGER